MRIYLSLALLLAACSLTAFGSACTNPCTGSSSTGQDTTDRNNFLSDNSSLTFSNITFNNGTWTTGLGGSVIDTATSLSFIGCLTNWSDCTSGSSNATVLSGMTYPGTWDGGSDPILAGAPSNGSAQLSTITISLPANVFAIGLDVLNLAGGAGAPFGVIVNGGSPATNMLTPLPGSTFFGYSSTTAITSFTVFGETGLSTVGIDNIDVGSLIASSGSGGPTSSDPATTPEASTMLLVASGLFMLRFARKLPVFSR